MKSRKTYYKEYYRKNAQKIQKQRRRSLEAKIMARIEKKLSTLK